MIILKTTFNYYATCIHMYSIYHIHIQLLHYWFVNVTADHDTFTMMKHSSKFKSLNLIHLSTLSFFPLLPNSSYRMLYSSGKRTFQTKWQYSYSNTTSPFCLKLWKSVGYLESLKWILLTIKAYLLWTVDQQWSVFPQSNFIPLTFHPYCGFNHVIHKLPDTKFHCKMNDVDCKVIRASVLELWTILCKGLHVSEMPKWSWSKQFKTHSQFSALCGFKG